MTKRKKKKHSKKKRKQTGFPFVKYGLIAGIWAGIFLFFLVLWYAKDLDKITEKADFKQKTSITFLDRNGDIITRYGGLQGEQVAVFDLPAHTIHAILAVEDRKFYRHHGVDPFGIMRAMVVNILNGRTVQGGSTLTQQLAKNLFLSNERSIKRKVQELLLALWLEDKFTKDEILTAYINRVYFGSGAYGIDAAAMVYFNKSATRLSLEESALIAGLLKAPSRYSPLNNPKLAQDRTKIVLGAMADAGYITQNELEAKRKILSSPLPLSKPSVDGRTERYFTDWLMDQIPNKIGSVTENITVQTTLDLSLQKKAETNLNSILKNYPDRNVTQFAYLATDYNGQILVMIGGKDYSQSQFNRVTQAKRQPGSAFKPFVYLTSFEQGYHAYDGIDDAPYTIDDYTPSNFDNVFKGPITIEQAFIESRNVPAIRLAHSVGIGTIKNTAQRLGISTPLKHEIGLALGASEVHLYDMVQAYGAIARKGKRRSLYGIDSIISEDGKLLYEGKKRIEKGSYGSRNAYKELINLMQKTVEEGTGKAARLQNFSLAGKTGTSQDYRDAWFIGFSDDIIAGVWMGNDDNSPTNNVTGGSLPAIAFAQNIKILDESISTGVLGSQFEPFDLFDSLLQKLGADEKKESDQSRPPKYNQ